MTIKVDKIMAARYTAVAQGSTIGLLDMQMSTSDVRHVLVLDGNGRLDGIFTHADLRRAHDKGGRGRVDDFMTRRLWTVRVTDDAVRVADLMLEHRVDVIPVVDDDGRPVGLVSSLDLISLARAQLATESIAVGA